MTLKNFRAKDFKVKTSASTKDQSRAASPAARVTPPPAVPTSVPVPQNISEDEVPAGTVPEVLNWVGEDKERAEKALAEEKKADKPRKGLIKALDEVIEES